VFAGGWDGVMRGYDKKSGRLVWSYDTAKPYKTVNDVAAHGGSFSMGGAVFAGDSLYLNSGQSGQGMSGNALIALKIPAQASEQTGR
jgi:polyvinyl alcohol dehydrogenase (cytochrome)